MSIFDFTGSGHQVIRFSVPDAKLKLVGEAAKVRRVHRVNRWWAARGTAPASRHGGGRRACADRPTSSRPQDDGVTHPDRAAPLQSDYSIAVVPAQVAERTRLAPDTLPR